MRVICRLSIDSHKKGNLFRCCNPEHAVEQSSRRWFKTSCHYVSSMQCENVALVSPMTGTSFADRYLMNQYSAMPL